MGLFPVALKLNELKLTKSEAFSLFFFNLIYAEVRPEELIANTIAPVSNRILSSNVEAVHDRSHNKIVETTLCALLK